MEVVLPGWDVIPDCSSVPRGDKDSLAMGTGSVKDRALAVQSVFSRLGEPDQGSGKPHPGLLEL